LFSVLITDFTFAHDTIVTDSSNRLFGPDSINRNANSKLDSKHAKFTHFISNLFLKHTTGISNKNVNGKFKQKSYSPFEGKPIRYIIIETFDPFFYKKNNSLEVPQIVFNTGNSLHIKSLEITIRNLLLIKQNQLFDSLRVKESERLIRSQKYVHEVFFQIVLAGAASDSVDILIRELDSWSIIADISISNSSSYIKLTDKNIVGLGHELGIGFTKNITNGANIINTNYFIPNIRNTYINSTLQFGIDEDKKYNRSFAIDRPFYSPLANWAAGAFIASQYQKDSLKGINNVYVPLNLRFGTQDYWAGIAHGILKSNTEWGYATNLILTARYLRIRYFEKPSALSDPSLLFSGQDFYFAGLGVSTRRYIQDRYILNYDVIEDVPVGKVYGFASGYQTRNDTGRIYFGMRYASGNYYVWGYLSSDFEYGTFFRSSHAEQGVITANIVYFTNLFEIGNYKFRQFVKPQVTFGIRRFPYDSLTINNTNGLHGFNSISVLGTRKIVLTFQTQSFTPWKLLGFHFGPYFVYSLGMLENSRLNIGKIQMYSQFSIGVLIKNDFLVFNTFQLSVTFYPNIPGEGQNVFKINSNTTSNFGFNDFSIGKPAMVPYQ
jgi:hypothetical protein